MDRVNRILRSEEYSRLLDKIDEGEKDRIYCKHAITHLLDVARMMYIEVLEKGIDLDKEVVYATALLHDIGRAVSNDNHAEESAKIAIHMLRFAGFDEQEISMVEEAILSHRTGSNTLLGDLLYRNDKLSRNCFYCPSQGTCKWKIKNEGIER